MHSIRRWKHPSVLVVCGVVASLVGLRLGGGAGAPGNAHHGVWVDSRASHLVFFAVLEGLYRDGVSNEEVDLIIPPNAQGKVTFDPRHFVYACPLCEPAFEAMRLYRQREKFFGLKASLDTLGPGLDAAAKAGLRSKEAGQQRKTIEALIARWVGQRLEMMRLTKAERESLTSEIEAGRKQGMNALKQPGEARTTCPICDGSFGACKRL